MDWQKRLEIFSIAIAIVSVVFLANVSASSFEYNNPTLPKLVLTPISVSSSGGSGSNVSSVLSANGCIGVSPVSGTGNVVLTWDISCNNGTSIFSYNETKIVLYGSNTYNGTNTYTQNQHFPCVDVGTFLGFGGMLGTCGTIFFGYDLGNFIQLDGTGNTNYNAGVQHNFDKVINAPSIKITGSINATEVNTTNLNALGANFSYLNVSINATIPHMNNNATFAFATNYSNRNGKAIRVDMSIQYSTSVLGTDTAQAEIHIQPFDSLTNKYIIFCGISKVGRLPQTFDDVCTFDVPANYNYSAYSVVVATGTIALREVHIIDE